MSFDVRFFNRASLSNSVFPVFVVSTAWVTLLYVASLAIALAATSIGRIGGGESRFDLGMRVWVRFQESTNCDFLNP